MVDYVHALVLATLQTAGIGLFLIGAFTAWRYSGKVRNIGVAFTLVGVVMVALAFVLKYATKIMFEMPLSEVNLVLLGAIDGAALAVALIFAVGANGKVAGGLPSFDLMRKRLSGARRTKLLAAVAICLVVFVLFAIV